MLLVRRPAAQLAVATAKVGVQSSAEVIITPELLPWLLLPGKAPRAAVPEELGLSSPLPSAREKICTTGAMNVRATARLMPVQATMNSPILRKRTTCARTGEHAEPGEAR